MNAAEATGTGGAGTSVSATTVLSARERVDASVKLPVLSYYVCAVGWLVFGLLLALIASAKLHSPRFLDDWGVLSFGRVEIARQAVLAYGWFSLGALGSVIWVLARLCRNPIRHSWLLYLGLTLWNVGMIWGVGAVLAGSGTGVPWLDFPFTPNMILTAGLLSVGLWAIDTIRRDPETDIYLSQWLILVALFVFPTVFVGANILLYRTGVTGMSASGVQEWYAANALGLWVAPLSLAILFYVIPQALGRSLFAYSLATLGVWCFLLSFNFIAPAFLIGSQLPAWVVSVSTLATMVAGFGVFAISLSLLITLLGGASQVRFVPSLRFLALAALMFPVIAFTSVIGHSTTVSGLIQFTMYLPAQTFLLILGLGSFVVFGAMYHIVPKLTGWEWSSAGFVKLHFWLATLGVLIGWVGWTLRGFAQGAALNTPTVSMERILSDSIPFFWGLTFALLAILTGVALFVLSFAVNVGHFGSRRPIPLVLGDPTRTRATRDQQSLYRRVFTSLVLVLVVEYLIATNLRGLGTLPLMLVLSLFAAVYVILVAWYLMYLKFEGRWVFGMLVPTCIMSTLLVLALIPDIVMPYTVAPNPQKDVSTGISSVPDTAGVVAH